MAHLLVFVVEKELKMPEHKSVDHKSQGIVMSVRGSVADIRFVGHLPR